jgi:hypothetical protein
VNEENCLAEFWWERKDVRGGFFGGLNSMQILQLLAFLAFSERLVALDLLYLFGFLVIMTVG